MISQRILTTINIIEIEGCVVGITTSYEHIKQKCDEINYFLKLAIMMFVTEQK